MNDRLRIFLEDSGFELASLVGMGIVGVDDVLSVQPADVTALGKRAADAATGQIDATFVSCGGLPALHLAQALEPVLDMPVIASSTAGVWGAGRLAGLSGDLPQLGALGRASTASAQAKAGRYDNADDRAGARTLRT